MRIEHERAKAAYQKIGDLKANLTPSDGEKLKSWTQKLPSMLLTCGLLQTIAFYAQKSDAKSTYNLLREWLLGQPFWNSSDNNAENFVQTVIGIDSTSRYQLVFREALAYSTWLKRAVTAMFPD
jgi:CRISPR type III-B/RAMP module-associated protein Cmr5